MDDQLVIFNLGSDSYGVNIGAVQSIIKMQPITTVPKAEQYVEGVINLRGSVLPVIDLRRRFDLPRQEATKDTRIVVVDSAGTTVGMVVDEVTAVLQCPRENVEPPSAVVTTADSTFIEGIARIDEQLVILLELGKVLTTQERQELEKLPLAV